MKTCRNARQISFLFFTYKGIWLCTVSWSRFKRITAQLCGIPHLQRTVIQNPWQSNFIFFERKYYIFSASSKTLGSPLVVIFLCSSSVWSIIAVGYSQHSASGGSTKDRLHEISFTQHHQIHSSSGVKSMLLCDQSLHKLECCFTFLLTWGWIPVVASAVGEANVNSGKQLNFTCFVVFSR